MPDHPAARRLRRAAIVALGISAAAGSARADTRVTRFATFLHVGPGMQYAVSDEIQTQVAVEVVVCQDQWCQVRHGRAYGWVTQNILAAAPQPIVPRGGKPPAACFDFTRSGWPHGGDLDNLCIYDQTAKRE